jgi:hypothetical protein
MTRLTVTEGLNREGQEEIIAAVSQTHAGMAHFALTGPAGRSCRECAHCASSGKWFSARGRLAGAPKPAPCSKFEKLMHLEAGGPPVPHDAHACKFFSENETPQLLRAPKEHAR